MFSFGESQRKRKGCEAKAEHHRNPSGDDWETDNVKGVDTNFRHSQMSLVVGGKPTPSNYPKGELTHLVLVRASSESEGHTSLAKYAPKGGGSTPAKVTGREHECALQLGAIAESERQQKTMIKGVQPLKYKNPDVQEGRAKANLYGHCFRHNEVKALCFCLCFHWCIHSTRKAQ